MKIVHSIWVVLLSFAFVASAADPLKSDPTPQTVTIKYDPTTREVAIALPIVVSDRQLLKDMPVWLAQVASQGASQAGTPKSVFNGVLPEINDTEGAFGAGANGAFLFGVLDWLPDLRDFAPNRIVLKTPNTHRALATTELISENETDQSYAATFRLPNNWRNTDVFFGPYEINERSVHLPSHVIAIRTYFRAEEQQFSDDYLDAVANYITRYSTELGPYPHKSFSVVSAPIPVGYALDGVTYISQQILGHPYMLGRSLAHEVLHSWWGSGVGIDYANGNWAEGLTTYQADYALAQDRDADAAKAMRREWLTSLSSLPAEHDRPLREFRSAGHGRDQSVGYGKSAMVFHMLRQSLGQPVFEESLKKFWQDNTGKLAGWDDLQQAFEAVANQDLTSFFSQFLDRTGLPQISLDSAVVQETGDAYTVEVQLSQKGAPYDLEVPMRIETVSGPVRETVRFVGISEDFEFELADQPLSVSVDPDFDILRMLADGELPPTVADVLRASSVSVIVGTGAKNSADKLLPQVRPNANQLPRFEIRNTPLPAEAFIAIGTTEEILELRSDYFEVDAPSVSREGISRAWVEVDDSDTHWLFMSSDNVAAIAEDLYALRYYSNQSFVWHEAGARLSSGRWPLEKSPMQVSFR